MSRSYEATVPIILHDYQNLYAEELRHIICALLNSPQGGQIVLVHQVKNYKIVEGFKAIYLN